MSDNVVPMFAKQLKCIGVGRDAENKRVLVASFNREPSDDDLRFFHDCLKRWASLA